MKAPKKTAIRHCGACTIQYLVPLIFKKVFVMRKAMMHVFAGVIFLLTACSSEAQQSTGNEPVETKKPNADYKSSFAGQTRIQSVKTSTAFDHRVVTNGLKAPWGIAA
ncbi:MAG: hypothetical protein ACK484_00565, partial [Sphingobacteriales bacterium]